MTLNYIYKNVEDISRLDLKLIEDIVNYQEVHLTAGSRPTARHFQISRPTAQKYRRIAGVKAKVKNGRPKPTKAKPETRPHPNLLIEYSRQKVADKPYKGFYYSQEDLDQLSVYCQDFSYIKTDQGFSYLSVVMDLASRFILSWNLTDNHQSSIINLTLYQALDKYPPPVMTHTDQGTEYLSKSHQHILATNNIQHSCSEAGKPWQNGFIERFLKNHKARTRKNFSSFSHRNL